jgi:GntR family transcriptional repressor for pyruvate dehydrogenase complex
MKIESLEKKVLSKEIFQNLSKLITSQQLKPGDKLPSEPELSQMMGVSRSSVREAIKILASRNIVEVIRGKGTYVCQEPGISNDPLGVGFINDENLLYFLFETRRLIEPGVAYLAAKRVTKSDLKKIKECQLQLVKAVEAKETHLEKDLEFHRAIAMATKNPIINRIVPIVNQSIIQGYYQTVNVPGSATKMIEFHQKIYDALKDGDCDKAYGEMQHHLDQSWEDIHQGERKDYETFYG